MFSSLSFYSFNGKSPLRERMRSSDVLWKEGLLKPIKSPFDNSLYLLFTYPGKENSGQRFMSVLGGERPTPPRTAPKIRAPGKTEHL
jgi:hypothetical protein